MSLILEALKKSERQRRLGEMPNLGTPVLAARRRRSLLPWLAGAIVVALAVGAWLRFAPPAETTTPARVDAAVNAPAGATPAQTPAGTAPARPAPAAPAPVAAAPAKPAATDARRNLRLPADDDRPGSVAELPVSPLVAGPRKPPATTPAAPAPTAPAAKPVAPKTAATPPPAKPAATVAADKPKAPPATATDAVVAKAKPAQPAPRKPAVPALPSIWEMPYAVRKDLPALALTMHVYSSVPAERFVVVEGERHVEGDDLGDGVTLREIRSDGIVLDFKGKRFVYPRDGR